MCGFCNVWGCVCVGFVMCGCVYSYVWVCNVWVCVRVGFVMCGCFGNVYLDILRFVLFVLCFCIVLFMYIYSYLLLVQRLLPTSENSIAVNNNNNNNDNNKFHIAHPKIFGAIVQY
jgi:hypothetical protein